jgi:hypothetical protein
MKLPQYIDCRPIAVEAWLINAGLKLRIMKEVSIAGLPVEIVLAKLE